MTQGDVAVGHDDERENSDLGGLAVCSLTIATHLYCSSLVFYFFTFHGGQMVHTVFFLLNAACLAPFLGYTSRTHICRCRQQCTRTAMLVC